MILKISKVMASGSEERFLSVEESSEESTQSSNSDSDENINFKEYVDKQLSQLTRTKNAEIGRECRLLVN